MVFNISTILLGAICIGGAVGYVLASWKSVRSAAVLAKIAASTSFVVLAFVNGAADAAYGRTVLAALFFSWIGDVLLLSRQSPFLLTGIAAFFVAHIAFSVAFAMRKIDTTVLAVGLVATGVFAVLILKWLWKHLVKRYRIAVPLYLAAVMVMVSLAAAVSVGTMPPMVAMGAIAFALSDISVARDRFVEPGVLNKAWGLPLYYAAQILFAASVTGTG